MSRIEERVAELVTVKSAEDSAKIHDVYIGNKRIDSFSTLRGNDGANEWVKEIRSIIASEIQLAIHEAFHESEATAARVGLRASDPIREGK